MCVRGIIWENFSLSFASCSPTVHCLPVPVSQVTWPSVSVHNLSLPNPSLSKQEKWNILIKRVNLTHMKVYQVSQLKASLRFSIPCKLQLKSYLSLETDSLESVTCPWVRSSPDKIFTFYLQEVKIPSCSSQPPEGLSCHRLSPIVISSKF